MTVVLVCVTIGINIPGFVITILLISIVLLIQAGYGYSLKAQLYYDLREALYVPQAPRPTTLPL